MELDKHNLDNLQHLYEVLDPDLQHAHISLKKINFEIESTNYVVSVDKKVPEDIELKICRHAKCRGLTVQFQTS